MPPRKPHVVTEDEVISNMKEEIRELDRAVRNLTDQVTILNGTITELLNKINAAVGIGSVLKNVWK